MSGHHHRHCVYCGKLSGDARTCVAHAPLLLLDPAYASSWSLDESVRIADDLLSRVQEFTR